MKYLASTTTTTCLILLRSTSHAFSRGAASNNKLPLFGRRSSSSSLSMSSSKPFSVIVEAEIKPETEKEFLQMMENNAVKSRQEPGCLRFDVLRAQDNPNKFYFYEVYKSAADVDFHKTQPHYQAWADFKEKGVVSSVSHKADGEFMGK